MFFKLTKLFLKPLLLNQAKLLLGGLLILLCCVLFLFSRLGHVGSAPPNF